LRLENSLHNIGLRSLTKIDRLEIARECALGLYDFQDTPWGDRCRLQDNTDIVFVRDEHLQNNVTRFKMYISQIITSDHQIASTEANTEIQDLQTIVNRPMWKLALLLIELCFRKQMQHIRAPGILYSKAECLMKTKDIDLKLGPNFKKAIKYCLKRAVSPDEEPERYANFMVKVIDNIDKTFESFGCKSHKVV
jgi:hypothetical protein